MALDQLPRGRHGIPREEVLASQRGRLLYGMTLAVAERGYAKATVADAIRRAGVSRETFYQQFADKEDCFVAALDATAGLLEARLETEDLLGAYLESLAANPEAARAFLIEVYGAGERAVERRVAMLQRFAELVAERTGADAFRCEAFVGAVSSLVTMRVATGRHAELPQLREPLTALAEELL